MSFIDIINSKFEELIDNNFHNDFTKITDITYIESEIISLFKKNNFNKDFDDNVEQIFSSIISKYIEHEDIFNNLVNDIKKEYNIYLNNLEKKHMELIKTKTYLIDTQ
jgi:hypothetical protein|tara:strand:+ start:2006 stop:2329 length:324 start_codon:yes stop_codon:yes gene_type:complete